MIWGKILASGASAPYLNDRLVLFPALAEVSKITAAKNRLGQAVMRVFITLVGISFIFWGFGLFFLGIAGETDTAIITGIRRQGGERREAIPNRYTYIVSYTFTLPGGRQTDGFSTKIGSAVYFKNSQSPLKIRYLAWCPRINAPESDTKPHVRQLVYILTGSFLVYVMNARTRKGKGKE